LTIWIWDPGWEKKSRAGIRDTGSTDIGSVINIPDLILEKLASVIWVKIFKFLDADSGCCQPWVRDGKKSDPG